MQLYIYSLNLLLNIHIVSQIITYILLTQFERDQFSLFLVHSSSQSFPLTLATSPLLNCTEFDRISNGSRAHKHGHQSPCVQHACHVVTSRFSSCVVTSRATSHRNVEATAGAARGDASYPPVSCAFMIACFMLLVVACRTRIACRL